MNNKPVAGTNGEKYVPYEERKGEESTVYFTRDLSSEGLKRVFERVKEGIDGKVAIKLHTGEKHGPNIIPRGWVKDLLSAEEVLKDARIVETNTYYEGDRYTTDKHRETLEVNGWTFCDVDIMDEDGVTALPVRGGKWFKEMHMIRCWCWLILKATRRADLAAVPKISVSVVQMAGSVKLRSILPQAAMICGILPKKSSWKE